MTLWPKEPLNAGPALRDGDSIITVRIQSAVAKWLLSLDPADITLGQTARKIVEAAYQAETGAVVEWDKQS